MSKKSCFIIFFVFLFSGSLYSDDFFSTWIPMRDGEYLAADVYSPDTAQPFPVILIKTPYNKLWYQILGLPLDTDDYTFIIVDWRGFYGSSGAAVENPNYGEDGYDCVEWIAQQSWCNAKIGMWGISALGGIQYNTAREHPPHLLCGIPIVADYMEYYQRYFCGGAMRTEYVQTLQMLGFDIDLLLEHPIRDLFWILLEFFSNYPQEIDVPMLLMGGWYDHHSYSYGIFRAFNDLTTIGGVNGREHHKLIIGPWHHHHVGDTVQGQLEYPNAAGIPETEALGFLDYWLRDVPNGYDTLPSVRYFQMGTDEWQSSEAWPPDSVSSTSYYLHPAGSLSVVMPGQTYLPDTFYYDPRDPSPSIGGAGISIFLLHGPYDQRYQVENRDDAVIFSTAVLTEDLVVDGQVSVQLYVSSNCLDTDFTVRLCDVYPDGRSMLVLEGIRRMRFRESFEEEILMIPGEIYEVTIDLPNVGLTFVQGHRVRICISSSNYSRFDINLNNGDSLYVPGDTLIALNRIYHDVDYPSALILPVENPTGVEEDVIYFDEKSNNIILNISPNPFSKLTYISFGIGHPDRITHSSYGTGSAKGIELKIFDVSGRIVKSFNLTSCFLLLASAVCWDGRDEKGKSVPSGIYFVQLKKGNEVSKTKKLLLIK